MSHFDLGVIRDLKTCSLGSRLAPKMRIRTADREYLLKRRAPGRGEPKRVAFTHSLQHQLAEWGYPVAELIRTRDRSNSVLELEGRVYELFDFVEGIRFDRSIVETGKAGASLGLMHRHLSGFQPRYRPPTGTYHAARELDDRFERLGPTLATVEPTLDAGVVDHLVSSLRGAYGEGAERVDATGFNDWDQVIIHGDWHPGNLLFRKGEVVAVLDFDSARLEPRVSDVANGVLQFSIEMGEAEDPLGWPEGLDLDRARAFVQGYDRASGMPLSQEERASLPWLIVEALVVESVVPVAATGRFAGIRGSDFLRMVRRKIRWLRPRAVKLADYLR